MIYLIQNSRTANCNAVKKMQAISLLQSRPVFILTCF